MAYLEQRGGGLLCSLILLRQTETPSTLEGLQTFDEYHPVGLTVCPEVFRTHLNCCTTYTKCWILRSLFLKKVATVTPQFGFGTLEENKVIIQVLIHLLSNIFSPTFLHIGFSTNLCVRHDIFTTLTRIRP